MDFLQGSTGAPFWLVHLLQICVDAAAHLSLAEIFFFYVAQFSPIRSEIESYSDRYGPKYLFKK